MEKFKYKRKNVVVSICLIFFYSISSVVCSQHNFSIQGKFSDNRYNGQIITLTTFIPNDTLIARVDTTQIANASFSFSGKENPNEFAQISFTHVDGYLNPFDVVLEKGNINIYIDEEGYPHIKGTPLNDFLQAFTDSIKNQNRIMGAAWHKLKDGEILQKELHEVVLKYSSFYKQIVKDNMSNMVGQRRFIIAGSSFDDDDLYYEILSVADENVKKHPSVKAEIARREQRKKEKEEKNLMDFQELPWNSLELHAGKKIADFQFYTPDGEIKQLYDYIGKSKFLYIDFWASWCSPCIAEMPNLKEMYKKYKSNGLEILGISFDAGKLDWMRGLERIDVPWPQLSDLETNSPIRTAYNIRAIPFGFLLDSEGVIIGGGLLTHSFHLEYIVSR